ncbi:uncharacterized protein sb:cb288 [Mugil cephalus]|uniref:uncharacterized protein sb:cb288 n=1 Tax=Mugil cephalus TaxID=48193 RepID=UPI001FB63723|nr:uncharacterized protein sb:cb288 [Mugil cephalus]
METKHDSSTFYNPGNGSKMVDPDLRVQLLHIDQQRNVSTAAVTHPSSEDSIVAPNGIIPGLIAATVFITFLLALYAVLWKCMVSPPRRKHSKLRVRVHPGTSV